MNNDRPIFTLDDLKSLPVAQQVVTLQDGIMTDRSMTELVSSSPPGEVIAHFMTLKPQDQVDIITGPDNAPTLASHDPDGFLELIRNLPEVERVAALAGGAICGLAVSGKGGDAIEMISALSHEQQAICFRGDNALHYLARYGKMGDEARSIFNALPVDLQLPIYGAEGMIEHFSPYLLAHTIEENGRQLAAHIAQDGGRDREISFDGTSLSHLPRAAAQSMFDAIRDGLPSHLAAQVLSGPAGECLTQLGLGEQVQELVASFPPADQELARALGDNGPRRPSRKRTMVKKLEQ